MFFETFVVFLFLNTNIVNSKNCYWNDGYSYTLFASKTPYDRVRGDIRDYKDPPYCQAVSLWMLNRHGNRNPGDSVIQAIRKVLLLRDEIIATYEEGNSKLCAQDVENLKNWEWDEFHLSNPFYLTSVGYLELYNIGKRLREKYPHLLQANEMDVYYLRPTNEERTISSALSFIQGFTEGTNLTLRPDEPTEEDEVIRPYEKCDKYQRDVRGGQDVADALLQYTNSYRYLAVKHSVQNKLGIETQLTPDDIFSLYEVCRFDRSWSVNLKSPWCSLFSYEDLRVLEYKDDVRHYYRNGYGSWVNIRLGQLPMKDLYESFMGVVSGEPRRLVSYFTHDTMIEMVFSALGMYQDKQKLKGSVIKDDRLWRTSYLAPTANNIIAILYSCTEFDSETFKFQLLHNEKVSELCPASGCSWEEFQKKFQPFENATLEFCDLNYSYDDNETDLFGSNANMLSLKNNSLVHLLSYLVIFVVLQNR